jgi:hypothetical protein
MAEVMSRVHANAQLAAAPCASYARGEGFADEHANDLSSPPGWFQSRSDHDRVAVVV